MRVFKTFFVICGDLFSRMASKSIFSSTNGIPATQNKRRSRSANWEHMEKALLKECIREHLSIIENKTCDTNTNKSKQLTWNKVLQRFNMLNNRQRSMGELKQQWRTLKLDAKKNASNYKRSLKQTGGGMKPPSPDPHTQEIINMITQEFEEDINDFDSDNLNWVDEKKMSEKHKTLEEETEGKSEHNNNPMEQDKVSINSIVIIEDENGSENNQMSFTPPLQKPKNKGNKKSYERNNMKERDIILIHCLKQESKLKLKQMAEAHEWAREEHVLKTEKLKLQNILLQKQIKDTE